MGARALFAFRRGQSALDAGPTDEEFLGAVMEAEFQRMLVWWVEAHRKDD